MIHLELILYEAWILDQDLFIFPMNVHSSNTICWKRLFILPLNEFISLSKISWAYLCATSGYFILFH